jgi:hypothetical protein
MRISRLRHVLSLAVGVLVVAFAGVPAARAAAPISLGPGGEPRIAVAGNTAYVAWLHDIQGPAGNTRKEIRYCRISVGGSACDVNLTFPPAPSANFNDYTPPFVLAGPSGRVVILTSYFGAGSESDVAFVSSDGGMTFPVTDVIGDLTLNGNRESAAALGPGADDVSMIGDQLPSYEKGSLTRPQSTSQVPLSSDTSYEGDKSVITVPGGVIVSFSSSQNTLIRGSIDGGMSFAAPFAPPGPAGSDAILAAGPGGVFVLRDLLPSTGSGYALNRFTNTGLAAATPIPGTAVTNHDEDFIEDASGGLDLLFEVLHTGASNVSLRYTSFTEATRTWTTPVDVVLTSQPGALERFAIGASAPGNGFAVYPTTALDDGTVYAAPLFLPKCVVPPLKGRSLAAARGLLSAHDCTLGAVHRPHGKHKGKKKLVVAKQSPKPGTVLGDRGAVAVTVAYR